MPYTGKVYMVDAVTNNPGAAGGALTTRKGELIGMIGRGLRNEQTGTWMNYSIPIAAAVEVKQPDGKTATTTMMAPAETRRTNTSGSTPTASRATATRPTPASSWWPTRWTSRRPTSRT